MPGSFCTVEGDENALSIVRKIVQDLGGIVLEITGEKKTLYHAAAVVSCNFLVTLVYLSYQLFETLGIPQDDAAQALLPLVKGTVSNIEHLGPVKALTGPIARGDVDVIRGHLEALTALDPRFSDMYRSISRLTVEVGIKKGTLSSEGGEEILQVLKA